MMKMIFSTLQCDPNSVWVTIVLVGTMLGLDLGAETLQMLASMITRSVAIHPPMATLLMLVVKGVEIWTRTIKMTRR